MTDGGRPVPFRYGKSFVVLEFLRNVHSYLGLWKDTPIVIRVICHRDTVRTIRGKPDCCDANRHMYEDYHFRQVGGLMPVFFDSRQQRGHGLGSVLGGIFRRFIIPFFQSHVKTLATDALKTGVNVAEDVLGGRTLNESVKKRVPEGKKRTAQSLIRPSRLGVRRRRFKRKRKLRPHSKDILAWWLLRTTCPANVRIGPVFRSTYANQHGAR